MKTYIVLLLIVLFGGENIFAQYKKNEKTTLKTIYCGIETGYHLNKGDIEYKKGSIYNSMTTSNSVSLAVNAGIRALFKSNMFVDFSVGLSSVKNQVSYTIPSFQQNISTEYASSFRNYYSTFKFSAGRYIPFSKMTGLEIGFGFQGFISLKNSRDLKLHYDSYTENGNTYNQLIASQDISWGDNRDNNTEKYYSNALIPFQLSYNASISYVNHDLLNHFFRIGFCYNTGFHNNISKHQNAHFINIYDSERKWIGGETYEELFRYAGVFANFGIFSSGRKM